jgi:hypothetical protein
MFLRSTTASGFTDDGIDYEALQAAANDQFGAGQISNQALLAAAANAVTYPGGIGLT